MNCQFCGEPLDNGRHPLTEGGRSRDVTSCQVSFLLRRAADLEARLADLRNRVDWVLNDMGYKPPEMWATLMPLWYAHLKGTLSRDGTVDAPKA